MFRRRTEQEREGEEDDLQSRLLAQRDQPGSRFSSRPGFAILTGESGHDPSGYDGDGGDAEARVTSAFGAALASDGDLGKPVISGESVGRGAAGWTAVVEWVLDAAGQGIIGLAVTAPLVLAAQRFRALLQTLRTRRAKFLINRGGAALVALSDVLENAPIDADLSVEAVEEISTVAGRPLSELNHVGADPWLVLLIDSRNRNRHIRVISVDGTVLGSITVPISDLEAMYLPPPQ